MYSALNRFDVLSWPSRDEVDTRMARRLRDHLSESLCVAVLGAATVFGSGSAEAAEVFEDVPAAPVAAIGQAAPIHIWSGPYAGAFVGYNTRNFDQSGGASFDGDGFVGGIYTGYNLQTDSLVYGVEADIGGSGFSADGFSPAAGSAIAGDTNLFGSLRARVGYDVDPFLLFATGGVAAARSELSSNGFSDSKDNIGYTVGGGVEAKITDDISTRLEYRYSDFGAKTYDLGKTSVSSGFDEHSIRAGVALKF